MKRIFLLASFLILTLSVSAQKPPLDHSVYDGWKSVGRVTIPNDGEWAFYNISPQEGDGTLEIYNVRSGKAYSVPRATGAILSQDGTKLVFKIAPMFQQTRKAKIDKKKPNEMPKDTLAVMDLASGTISKFPFLKAFKAGEKMGSFIAFQEAEKPAPKKAPESKSKGEKPEMGAATSTATANNPTASAAAAGAGNSANNGGTAGAGISANNAGAGATAAGAGNSAANGGTAGAGISAANATPAIYATPADDDQMRPRGMELNGASSGDASDLYILNIKTLAIDTIKCVSSYSFAKEADKLAYITNPGKKDSTVLRGIFLYEPAQKESTTLLTGEKKSTFASSVSFSEDGSKLAFMANIDTTPDAKKMMNIYLYNNGQTSMIVAKDADGIPAGWKISDQRRVQFYNNDNYITFGTCPVPREKDTTLVDFEQPKLDIWTWNEDELPTVQLYNLQRDRNRSFLAKYDLKEGKVIQLADEQIPSVSIDEDNVQNLILAVTDKPYKIRQQWDASPLSDIYLISLQDGSRTLYEKGATYQSGISSPDGAYYVTFNTEDRNWYIITIATGEKREISSSLGVQFWDDEVDTPSSPRPYGYPIWFEGSKAFLLADKYDMWQFDPTGSVAPFCMTEGVGRSTTTRYSYTSPYNEPGAVMFRASSIKPDKPVYFTTFNEVTKETGISCKDITKKKSKLTKLTEGKYTYANLAISAGKKPSYIYVRGNFEDGSNLWMTKDNFKTQTQLSDANPQQKEYNWGTVELVSWTTKKDKKAEGLLFKPENFDPAKKYPVMIYFYERNSETLYASRVPAPSRSTVNIPYYVSNEYIVFVPDIYYEIGHPGQSALDCILPACDKLCENPWFDGDNMAIQGQSWGGYQVAYMITQTNRFKAAGAGAPVSNMTSAYGGIRWESGRVREFQYEQQQSRIGKDLWSGFDLYVENSPVFFVPNVTTPVLIMHNDNDGAVPWWQGIEYFTALKRCGKQAWMLQYNGESHNLVERRNSKDLSIRLQQFFDHFLKGAPMPVWMADGIPATLKGIDLGYELK
ncbi:MAG: prolyl oligopeptidase family serine peptidase [Bacteroidales bacterium]|nr:prolyl oligopeptidase family serine peptidase [Bacteroidales bacterium]